MAFVCSRCSQYEKEGYPDNQSPPTGDDTCRPSNSIDASQSTEEENSIHKIPISSTFAYVSYTHSKDNHGERANTVIGERKSISFLPNKQGFLVSSSFFFSS